MPILSATERIGTLIDEKYAVARILAEGGMGVVFEATHTWTGRRVALKLLKPDFVDPKRNARLQVEARAAAALNHPNVVQVLDMGLTDDGVSYLVMELLEGRSLADELAARGALPEAEALSIVLPLLGAIAVTHARGIVHRDLKPANVFLCVDAAGRQVPTLLDFGIAKLIEQTGVTKSGAVLGTPHYLSPEQAEGQAEIGPSADIWAFGVMLYQCLTGTLPFGTGSASSVLARVLNGVPVPLRTHAPHVGSGLAAAIERALARDPQARYTGAASFARALLLTARADGIALPHDPEPLGLPEWKAWLRDSADDAAATLEDFALPHAGQVQRKPTRGRAWVTLLVAAALVTASAYALTRRVGMASGPASMAPRTPPSAADLRPPPAAAARVSEAAVQVSAPAPASPPQAASAPTDMHSPTMLAPTATSTSTAGVPKRAHRLVARQEPAKPMVTPEAAQETPPTQRKRKKLMLSW
jgi:serine/threonine protein kinase